MQLGTRRVSVAAPRLGTGTVKALKPSAGSLPFLCNWIFSIGITPKIDPCLPPDHEESLYSQLKDGLLLCKIVQTLLKDKDKDAAAMFSGLNKKPFTRAPCIKNLETALRAVWQNRATAANMCDAEAFYTGNVSKVTRCMLEVFRALQMPSIRAQAKEILSDFNAGLRMIGRPLPQALILGPLDTNALVEKFADSTLMAGILVLRGKLKAPALAKFRGLPHSEQQDLENAELLCKALDNARVTTILEPPDWLNPPEPCPDTLLYMLHWVRQRLRIGKELDWSKDSPKDLSGFMFWDEVPLDARDIQPEPAPAPSSEILSEPSHVAAVEEKLSSDVKREGENHTLGAKGGPETLHQDFVMEEVHPLPETQGDNRRRSNIKIPPQTASEQQRSTLAQRKSLLVRTAVAEDPHLVGVHALSQRKSLSGRSAISEEPSSAGSRRPVVRDVVAEKPKLQTNAPRRPGPSPRNEQYENSKVVATAAAQQRSSLAQRKSLLVRSASATDARSVESSRARPDARSLPKADVPGNQAYLPTPQGVRPRVGTAVQQPKPATAAQSRWESTTGSQNQSPSSQRARRQLDDGYPSRKRHTQNLVSFESSEQDKRLRMQRLATPATTATPTGQFIDKIDDIVNSIHTMEWNAPQHWDKPVGQDPPDSKGEWPRESPKILSASPSAPLLCSSGLSSPSTSQGHDDSCSPDYAKSLESVGSPPVAMFGNGQLPTCILADVMCLGDMWPAWVHTSTLDAEGGANQQNSIVLDIRTSDSSKTLRARVAAARIIDIKSAPNSSDGDASGESFFVMVDPEGIHAGAEADGLQMLPDQSLAVLHISAVGPTLEPARIFFAELLLLAQFLSQNDGLGQI